MQYTKENLETQLRIRETYLESEKKHAKNIISPEYMPAIEYGEQTRINHLRRAHSNIAHYEKQILELKFKIADME